MTHPFQTNVSSRYGAPMGRKASRLDPNAEEITIRNVPIDSGGYDEGGAYWGIGQTLFCFQDDAGNVDYMRQPSSRVAIECARAISPDAAVTFEPVHSTIYWLTAECGECDDLVSMPAEAANFGICDCGAVVEDDQIIDVEEEIHEFDN